MAGVAEVSESLVAVDIKDKVLEKYIKESIRKQIDEIKKQWNFGTRLRELILP